MNLLLAAVVAAGPVPGLPDVRAEDLLLFPGTAETVRLSSLAGRHLARVYKQVSAKTVRPANPRRLPEEASRRYEIWLGLVWLHLDYAARDGFPLGGDFLVRLRQLRDELGSRDYYAG